MLLHSYGFGSPNVTTSLGCSPGYCWWMDSIPEIFSRGRSTSLKERTTIVSCAIRMSKKQLFTFSSHALLVRLVGSTLVFSGTLRLISFICCCKRSRGSCRKIWESHHTTNVGGCLSLYSRSQLVVQGRYYNTRKLGYDWSWWILS